MNFVIKRIISVIKEKQKLESISDESGPFDYVYIAIIGMQGIKIGDKISDTLHVFSFSDIGAEAFLANDLDRYCEHMEKSSAVVYLAMTGLSGSKRFGKLSKYFGKFLKLVLGVEWYFNRNLSKECDSLKRKRRKEHTSDIGSYLIYIAKEELKQKPTFKYARKIGGIGFGFDIINNEWYVRRHRNAIHTAATALSLYSADTYGASGANLIGDVVYLTGKDGLTVYPRNIHGHSSRFGTSKLLDNNTLNSVKENILSLYDDTKIEMAVTLFIQSQHDIDDNLRAFISAWSALELLINRLEKLYRNEWNDLLGSENGSLPEWNKKLKDIPIENYNMADRFYAVSCVLNLISAADDAAEFFKLNKMRNGFYHSRNITDETLPTADAHALFQKYLILWLKKNTA